MRKSHHHLLKELPKTYEKNLHLLDPAVAVFVRKLAETEDDKINTVIDEMFVHYTEVIQNYQKQLAHILCECNSTCASSGN
jgi:hypothetical protein